MSDDPAGVVGESDSHIAVLTSVIREKDKQVEELQHKLEDSSLAGVSTVIIGTSIIQYTVLWGW